MCLGLFVSKYRGSTQTFPSLRKQPRKLALLGSPCSQDWNELCEFVLCCIHLLCFWAFATRVYTRVCQAEMPANNHQVGNYNTAAAHLAGLDGSTVPWSLAVSGAPSLFTLLPSATGSVECLVSVLESPACFCDIFPCSGSFEEAACCSSC